MALNSGGSGGGSGAIRAGRAFVELFTKNNLAAGLNSAAKDLKAFGSRVSGLGRAFVGLGAAGAASLIPMANTLSDLAKQGSIANALGLTSEQFTGIAAVAKSVGNDTKEFIESLVTLGKLGTDAAAGTEQASQAFADLGLNANEFIKLRADEQFFQVFESLNKIQDPLKRTRALMLAFGEDGGKILLPLLGKSGDELRKMAAGFAISGEDMAKATAASKSYTDATTALSRAWQSVSVSAAPFVKMLGEGIAQGVNVFREWINANREVVVGVGLAVGGVTALGLGMMALGPVIKGLALSWAAFTGIVSGGLAVIGAIKTIILTPILAIPAALAAAGAYFLSTSQTVRNTLGEVFGRLKESWSGIVGAMTRGDFQLAFQIAVATVKVEWANLVNFMDDQWQAFKNAFTLDNIKQVFKDALEFIRDQFLATFDAIRDGDYSGAFGFGSDEPRQLSGGGGGAGRGVAATLGGDWDKVETEAEKTLRQLLITNKFRQAFASMKGNALTPDAGNPLAPQLNNLAIASRGTFGGSASSGFFGGSGGVGQKIADNTKKTVELLEKNNKLLTHLQMGGGELMFVGGK